MLVKSGYIMLVKSGYIMLVKSGYIMLVKSGYIVLDILNHPICHIPFCRIRHFGLIGVYCRIWRIQNSTKAAVKSLEDIMVRFFF